MKMTVKSLYKYVWLCPLLVALLCQAAYAAISLEAPERIGKGNAFVATARSDTPVDSIVFSWQGKKYPIKAVADGMGASASILLPVALDAKTGTLEVGAQADSGPAARRKILIGEVKLPVQKLQVDKKYVAPPPQVQERIKADREKVRRALASGQSGRMWTLPFARPVQGSVSSQFGLRRLFNGQLRGEHRGLDLRGAQGAPVKACADGVVALVDDLYYSGNTVYVDHGDGVFTAYLHLSATNVHPGQHVSKGQILGKVGATGRVTGPHLHLSLLCQGTPVNPSPLLEQRIATSQNKGGKNAK